MGSFVGKSTVKDLSLRQVRDIIQDMYVQKVRYDSKCADTRLPKETMEQYMYTYLNQLYGIKSLIHEWANAIFEGIKKYSPVDADILLFGRIVHNEVPEDFVVPASQLKDGLRDALRDSLQKSLKYKDEHDVFACIEAACASQTSLDESTWNDVISRFFDADGCTRIGQRVRELLEQRSGPTERSTVMTVSSENKVKPKEEKKANAITLAELQNIVLEFEVGKYEKQCLKFAGVFKKVDTDTNGLINAGEFRELIAEMKAPVDAEKLLKMLDPLDTQQIPFSKCYMTLASVT